MLSFFLTFSDSFLLALLAWPFVALLITIPILVMQYRRYNRLVFWRTASTYLFVLSCLALVSFTLYPMPDTSGAFCAQHHLTPQVVPLQFIADIRTDGTSALLQVAMNVVFFIPLGFFAARLLHLRFWVLAVLGLGVSFTIEVAQLTGVFGLYPCSYRLFDVDDLLFNVIGALLGYGLGWILPKKVYERAAKGEYTNGAGLVRHTVSFLIDGAVVQALSLLATIALYFVMGAGGVASLGQIIQVGAITLIFGILPFMQKGRSLGGYFTRMRHDDGKRPVPRRMLYYIVRSAFVAGLMLLSGGWVFLLVVITVVGWVWKKKLPYQFV